MAEQHLYGSSRLGIMYYDTAAYHQVYENGTGLTDTSISKRVPWYSFAQQDWIKADKASEFTGATYNQSTDTLREQRELGMKQYEMTDHLGNVLTTVLDRKTGYGNSGGNYTGFSADVASVTDYYPFGFPMSERSITADNLNPFRFGSGGGGQEKTDEIAGKGNHYTALFWEYNTQIARRWNQDPIKNPSLSPYSAFMDNPILLVDKDGNIPGLPSKKEVANFITSAAEYASQLYNQAVKSSKEHPLLTKATVVTINTVRAAADVTIDQNPKTLGWADLAGIWLFELGNYKNNIISFSQNDKTTQDLKVEEGVSAARATAIANIEKGDFSMVSQDWTYGQKEFYDGLKEKNIVTSFLGSYHTNIIPVKNDDGSFTLNYTVTNTSGWESATRLRKDNDKNGQHDAIIPNKKRGEGIPLGGNLTQKWQWSETIPASKKQ